MLTYMFNVSHSGHPPRPSMISTFYMNSLLEQKVPGQPGCGGSLGKQREAGGSVSLSPPGVHCESRTADVAETASPKAK